MKMKLTYRPNKRRIRVTISIFQYYYFCALINYARITIELLPLIPSNYKI